MSSFAGTAAWSADRHRSCGRPSRGLEIAGIILGFIFVWPLALAYVIWKFAGYPMPEQARETMERKLGWTFPRRGQAAPRFHFGHTGNSAFEDYRRRELERLEEERRRLDEEARAFGEFVEELKRARDREEFEAFMDKRRGQQTEA